MWLHAATAAFSTAVKSLGHAPSGGRQLLLDPHEGLANSSDPIYPYYHHPHAHAAHANGASSPFQPPPHPHLSGAYHSAEESPALGFAGEVAEGLQRGGSAGGSAAVHGPFNNLRPRAVAVRAAGGAPGGGADLPDGLPAGSPLVGPTGMLLAGGAGGGGSGPHLTSLTPTGGAAVGGGGGLGGKRVRSSGALQQLRAGGSGSDPQAAAFSPLANGVNAAGGPPGAGGVGGMRGSGAGAALAAGGVAGRVGVAHAASYEVYVDSEDEEGGWLLRRGPRQALPRYGRVRMALRRLCCCA